MSHIQSIQTLRVHIRGLVLFFINHLFHITVALFTNLFDKILNKSYFCFISKPKSKHRYQIQTRIQTKSKSKVESKSF